MKKRILALIMLLAFCAAAAAPVFAASEGAMPLLIDDADLLGNFDEQDLLKRLNEVSQEYEVDVAIVTVDSIGRQEPQDAAKSLYHRYGFGPDGVILLVSMEYRDVAVYTRGVGYDAISDRDAEDIIEKISGYLSDGSYAKAFDTYVTECQRYINSEVNFNVVINLVIALAVGSVVAVIVILILRGQLRSVRYKAAASEYLKPGSMNVTQSQDLYLYRTVDRRPKPKSSSSSGGRGSRQGGASGKF